MIDLHCHILPGVDDGAQTLDDSIAMAKAAVQENITAIVATPHHANGSYDNDREKIIERVNLLNQALVDERLPLTILPGQETRIFGDIVEAYEQGELITLNDTNKYVFVEFPSGDVPAYSERVLYDLMLKGLKPVIVHPERNKAIIEQPDKLYRLVKKGCIAQVTAGSLTGHFGKKIKMFSFQLLEHGLAHLVASDAHNTSTRGFHLAESYDVLDDEFGLDMVMMLKENAELTVDGRMLHVEMPSRIKRKKILGLF
ncbi:tyrosine-protein phosphatase [Aureibacillus halotolerans]|uniref:Tyrosine-protein phosphatase n=1 Tax=Aureibacillus halotolerans TaxID=1508390 RepID=A0A4R6U2P6_9BACI|nr:CpsB/CapC family capsule biosynthesis tyrosine phosphatase [Aureibacillus halotolerans]TDQ38655.1 protein-tyrosine phosphatase [Aureibacillus halotolerans]